MKKQIILGILGLSLFLGGCVNTNPKWPTHVTDPAYPAFVQENVSEVKVFATVSTGSYLLSVSDKNKKVKTAQFAYEVATAVSQRVDTGVTLEDLKQYAVELIAKNSNDADRQLVGDLVNVLVTYIDSKLNNEFKVTFSQQDVYQDVARQMIKGAADSVAQVTKPYTVKPSTVPAKAEELNLPK